MSGFADYSELYRTIRTDASFRPIVVDTWDLRNTVSGVVSEVRDGRAHRVQDARQLAAVLNRAGSARFVELSPAAWFGYVTVSEVHFA